MFKSNRIPPVSKKKREKRRKKKNCGKPAPHDPTLSGPVSKRAFTDVFCCIIFIAAVVGYIIIGGSAWLHGNPLYIIYEQNSSGGFCGIGPNVDKPSVFYFDVLKCASAVNLTTTFKGPQCPTTQVCVKQCPSAFWFLPPNAFSTGEKPTDFFQQEFCDPSLDLAQTTFTVQEILDKELCPAYYTPSKPVKGKCLPSFDPDSVPSGFTVPGSTVVKTIVKNIMDATSALSSRFNAKSMKVRLIEDLFFSWHWMLIGLVIALAVSMVLLLLMRYCVSVVIVLFITGVLTVGTYGIYQSYQEYQKNTDAQLPLGDLSLQSKIQVKDVLLSCLVAVCLLEFLLFIIFLSCVTKGLNKALALMRECSKATGVMLSTMTYPLVTFLLVTLSVSFTVVTSVNLATSGLPVYNKVALHSTNADCNAITGKEKCDPECTLAKTFGTYYWSLNKPQNIPRSTVSRAFFNMIRYHTGSMAFGAVFLTMFQVIRVVQEYLEDLRNDENRLCCLCYLLKTPLNFCFFVWDKFFKYFNRNTYVMIAIYGDNYFLSAKNTCILWAKIKDKVVEVAWVTDLLLFFGRLLVVGAISILAFCFFNGDIKVSADIYQAELMNYGWLPIIVLMVGSYFIAQGCFSVYNMGVDTFILCTMDDLERSDGTLQRPYKSKSMIHILQQQGDYCI
ncbi:choline transporter-like protein 4 isoform X2 [Tachysurus fulvidraco]|uniref:choline transporter-like protein 4 isoform X2 n=1 Tax=Tachysurus fulvidraco TaxID=1234273 RepID=UPI001FF0792F|nr:choline transporter-like protein 4 isoform X2 [Tachysurus fulvidraco]